MTWLEKYFSKKLPLIENGLDSFLDRLTDAPRSLVEAMRYSVKAGGKRLRPILVLDCAETAGGTARDVLPAACAMELLHTYSLIHDDLPAMDDDDFRRGKPTNHKVFGEGTAVLAGDALLTHAFTVLCLNARIKGIDADRVLRAIEILSMKAGAEGMVGGQTADLEAEGLPRAAGKIKSHAELLDYIHLNKTAALIEASCEIGALLGGAKKSLLSHYSRYGKAIGLAFQIADDILDVTGNKKRLGKSGSDAKNKKLTYASLYGIEQAGEKALWWIKRAHESANMIKFGGKQARPLHEIADYIVARDR